MRFSAASHNLLDLEESYFLVIHTNVNVIHYKYLILKVWQCVDPGKQETVHL